MKAAELMSKDPLSIPDVASVNDALRVFVKSEVRHLPVVDNADHVVGMLSDRDLAGLPKPEFAGGRQVMEQRTPLASPVSAFMSRDTLSVTPDTEAVDVVDIMLNHRVGSVPVVDEDNTLQGIITYTDVLKRCRRLV